MCSYYSPNNRANKRLKIVMDSTNVVVDDQGIVSTNPRSYESETEGPLHRPKDDASANDATPRNGSSPDIEDASPFVQSLSQPKDPTISSVRSNQEAPKAWYERLIDYLVKKGYSRGMMDHFVKHMNS